MASEYVARDLEKGALSMFGYENKERKLRNEKMLRKDAGKCFKG